MGHDIKRVSLPRDCDTLFAAALHEDIARDLNTSREVVSRLLKQLERLGRVSLARNKISVVFQRDPSH